MICAPDSVYNIIADQGATFTRSISLKNTAKQPVSLAGYTARMLIKELENPDVTVKTLNTENGKLTITAATGTITINMTAAEMAEMVPDTYDYDLEIVETATGTVSRVVEGTFKLRAEVTR